MKWARLFLFLLLIPSLIYGINEKECTKIQAQVAPEWNRCLILIEQLNQLGLNENTLPLLTDAIACCRRAIAHCDTISNDIASKSKSKRKEYWRVQIKAACEKDKLKLNEELTHLQNALNHVLSTIDCEKANILAQKTTLKERLLALKDDAALFQEKNLKRSFYEVQKQILPILEQLIESGSDDVREVLNGELIQVKHSIAAFEKEADSCRLTESPPIPSQEEFRSREKKRRGLFFKNDFLLNPSLFFHNILYNAVPPFVIPLDGQKGKKANSFIVYTEQFYRFLVQSEKSVSELFVKVYEKEKLIHEEQIALPFKNPLGWERYLKDGMIFIPETKLKTEIGLDLRLRFACDPKYNFSMIIAQKSDDARYRFSISLGQEEHLYECNVSEPPPWQLGVLRKPALPSVNKPIEKSPLPNTVLLLEEKDKQLTLLESVKFPLLDQLVEQLKGDPLALAGYVHNEIALIDPFLHQENGIFHAPSIHRNACITYLEGQGSPWEQCQLLVYLLRKAGYQAVYAGGALCSLPTSFAEKMLLTQLPEEQQEALIQYPWVLFFDGKEWISLFPWMKEMQVLEGYDLYSLMPEDYASADRWILHYLKGDENILKHIGPDGDDTAGLLFVRFIEEELRKQGLSLSNVGIHRTQIKKQFSSWRDFPHPSIKTIPQVFASLNGIPGLFATALIEVYSHENPQKKLSFNLPLAHVNCNMALLSFSSRGENHHNLHIQIPGEQEKPPLDLDPSDHLIDIKVTYIVPLGTQSCESNQTLSITKGTSAVLCSHFGGASPQITSQCYAQFSSQKDEKKRIHALLSFVGASYFEKCGRTEKILAGLHKINPATAFGFGLAKLSPDLSKSPFRGEEDLTLPQVDMFWFRSKISSNSSPSVWHQEIHSAHMQLTALTTVDSSSNEHQILRDIFQDPYAVSTVRLLQLSHLEQQKKGLSGEGFLIFTPSIFETAEKTPEAAQSLYFSHLKDLKLREVKATSPGQWSALKRLLDSEDPLNRFSYAYMTPGSVFNQDSSSKEMGSLIFSPYTQYALISNNNLVLHGGLGSPLPRSYLTASAIKEWQLIPSLNNYTLQLPSQFSATPLLSPGTTKYSPDVRAEHKSFFGSVGDPVDVVTGAFYIDEADLVLPGSFPLEIRRNYNNQNPLLGSCGCGWKLSLNPFLIKQDDKLYAAEADGTIITYRFNKKISRWEIFPEDNPDLYNFNKQGIGSTANPFHAYIENNVLYGSDGSKRYFEDGLLKKWINTRGDILTFFYNENRLSRVDSSNGDFFGLLYNHEGKISEIYAKDGRRISYGYDSQGDLVKVVLPNTATISYEYDQSHRIIRETRPHGKVLENIYDDQGRVKEQRSPMGFSQEMITTATFDYQEEMTIVTDAGGGKTTYKIYQGQIYKITDPLGFQTLQSWFIDEKSWFDPKTESVSPWNQPGGAPRSLKSTTDKRGLTTYYLYDNRGNPEEIGLKGLDLTGKGEGSISTRLTYNDQNLCTKEEVLERRTTTTYDKDFPYLPKKVEKYNGNTLLSCIDWQYNAFGQIEKENHSGAVTLWQYNARGYLSQRTQITGTEDPDVITTYFYNNQGQCIKAITTEGIQENDYDIMGNTIQSQLFSPSGTLISATYVGYNLNSQPIWKQTANSQNVLYLDYHASGLLKASRQSLTPNQACAYTLYEYDSRGYLIEEVDPLGYCTYREYDALGKILRETKEEYTTLFSYEPGGLLETITSPSGAKITRLYTSNGLLKEEIYPDGTKNSTIYDFFGRPIQETKKGISWEIQYDDPNHRIIRTHLETKALEIQEFDARGNLIRFTDPAGYTLEKTYDGLNRLKTEITPSGNQTLWNYQGDTLICTLPNGEKTLTRYVGDRIVQSDVINPQGDLIARSACPYDPEIDCQKQVLGEEITLTWMNTLGLPIKVQKGNHVVTYEYDPCGNCITSIDAEGRVTHQAFDGLRRLIQKELPDGSLLKYAYDLDSNLIECHLPNLVTWKAFYDSMGRKRVEELQADTISSQRWEFSYENGYLTETKDPLQRIHTYGYNLSGRLAEENVDGWCRKYTYDPRGLLTSAEQMESKNSSWLASLFYTPKQERSLIERSYDSDGRLDLESTYLNSNLIQQTRQTWKNSNRSLQIDSHERNFIYQNEELVQVSVGNINLSYSYNLNGNLNRKSTPLHTSSIRYNTEGLPRHIDTHLPDGPIQEALEWDRSGKLSLYSSSSGKQKQFIYNSRGHLKSAGDEHYEFDFEGRGTGVRTTAPGSSVPQEGLDAFNKVVKEITDKNFLKTTYNPMGEVISQNQRLFEWDPWGRLLKVTDPIFTWEASYDALGRRLQTHYTPNQGSTLTTTSLYDPEEEFQEIGIKCGDKTFWKLYGPDSCDAIIDETGDSVFLIYNALGQLTGVISEQKTLHNQQLPSSYGPQTSIPSISSDLPSYAQSLIWHSQSQDPTGLIWMGARYYDPKGGRFLSPDPIAYPHCLDLYAYANGDPINYIDSDGRFASHAYHVTADTVISTVHDVIPQIRSHRYEVGSINLANGAIGFINGINNSKLESSGHALRLSQYGQGVKIQGIYNASHTAPIDVLECMLGHLGFPTPPVRLLKKQWKEFIATYGPTAKFLQIGHSGGAIHIANALRFSAKGIRDRISVLAIAPGAVVPSKLCYHSDNYASIGDLVPLLDVLGNLLHHDELIWLEPHKDARSPHSFDSPTFKKPIQDHIDSFIKQSGGFK